MMEKYYIAYGSNLNKQQMRWRCPGAKIIGKGWLFGYRLLFRGSKTGSYLTIEEAEGEKIPVAVYEVTPADVRALDRYEGFPTFYYKKYLTCDIGKKGKSNIQPCFVYIMREDRPYGLPSPAYMETCLEGYRDFGIKSDALLKAYEYTSGMLGIGEGEEVC